jgi:hypothetical protein
MSGSQIFASVAGAASFLQTILVAPIPRSIASIIPGCAIEERHVDRVVVTQHPVEIGAAISDHTYQLPSEVTLRWAWSNVGFGQGDGYVQVVYQQLLALQIPGTLFNLYTGKKAYQNMVLTSLMVTTDRENENVLMCVAVCQQVIIASTQAATVPASSMANPQQNAPTTSTGAQAPQPAPKPAPSLLSTFST